MSLTNQEQKYVMSVRIRQSGTERRSTVALTDKERKYVYDYDTALAVARGKRPYGIDELPKSNTTTATADDVVNLERVQKKGWSGWMAMVNGEVVTVDAHHSKKNAPDAIAKEYNQKHAKTDSRYVDEAGELNQFGSDELSELNEEWAVQQARDAIGDNDADVARIAIEMTPRNFVHYSDRIKDDDDLARLAVGKLTYNFGFCSERLRDDIDFARFAIEKGSGNFDRCSDRLRDDYDFARLAVDKNQDNFKHCSDRLRDNTDLARLAVEKRPNNITRFAIDKNTYNFRHCSDRLRDDAEFARAAVENMPCDFEFCSDRLQADPLMQAYKTLVEAERNRKDPDLTAFPQPIQDAWNIQTPFLSSSTNDKEARAWFVGLARGAMEAEARRQQSPSDQVHDTDPVGIDAEDLLPELAAFNIDPNADPYANHPARALKPASNDDGHDLHRGPR